MLAPVGPFGFTFRLISAGVPVCVAVNVSGVAAGRFGSEPVTEKAPASPETTVCAAMGSTVGASAPVTCTVAVEVLVPHALVAVNVNVTSLGVAGAVYTGLAMVRLDSV